jgi:hypothetical protein
MVNYFFLKWCHCTTCKIQILRLQQHNFPLSFNWANRPIGINQSNPDRPNQQEFTVTTKNQSFLRPQRRETIFLNSSLPCFSFSCRKIDAPLIFVAQIVTTSFCSAAKLVDSTLQSAPERGQSRFITLLLVHAPSTAHMFTVSLI